MHRQFMHDLQRLRLNATKSYAESLLRSENPISDSITEPLKLNVLVCFLYMIVLLNTSTTTYKNNHEKSQVVPPIRQITPKNEKNY